MSISLISESNTELNDNQLIEDLEIVSYDTISSLIQPLAKINQTIKWDEETDIINKRYVIKKKPIISCEIAKIHNNVVGYAIIIEKENSSESNYAYIPFLAVDSHFKSKGIGSKLFSSSIKKVKRLGIQKIKLKCKKSNEPFYKRCAEKNHLKYRIKEDEAIPDTEGDYWSKFLFQLPPE